MGTLSFNPFIMGPPHVAAAPCSGTTSLRLNVSAVVQGSCSLKTFDRFVVSIPPQSELTELHFRVESVMRRRHGDNYFVERITNSQMCSIYQYGDYLTERRCVAEYLRDLDEILVFMGFAQRQSTAVASSLSNPPTRKAFAGNEPTTNCQNVNTGGVHDRISRPHQKSEGQHGTSQFYRSPSSECSSSTTANSWMRRRRQEEELQKDRFFREMCQVRPTTERDCGHHHHHHHHDRRPARPLCKNEEVQVNETADEKAKSIPAPANVIVEEEQQLIQEEQKQTRDQETITAANITIPVLLSSVELLDERDHEEKQDFESDSESYTNRVVIGKKNKVEAGNACNAIFLPPQMYTTATTTNQSSQNSKASDTKVLWCVDNLTPNLRDFIENRLGGCPVSRSTYVSSLRKNVEPRVFGASGAFIPIYDSPCSEEGDEDEQSCHVPVKFQVSKGDVLEFIKRAENRCATTNSQIAHHKKCLKALTMLIESGVPIDAMTAVIVPIRAGAFLNLKELKDRSVSVATPLFRSTVSRSPVLIINISSDHAAEVLQQIKDSLKLILHGFSTGKDAFNIIRFKRTTGAPRLWASECVQPIPENLKLAETYIDSLVSRDSCQLEDAILMALTSCTDADAIYLMTSGVIQSAQDAVAQAAFFKKVAESRMNSMPVHVTVLRGGDANSEKMLKKLSHKTGGTFQAKAFDETGKTYKKDLPVENQNQMTVGGQMKILQILVGEAMKEDEVLHGELECARNFVAWASTSVSEQTQSSNNKSKQSDVVRVGGGYTYNSEKRKDSIGEDIFPMTSDAHASSLSSTAEVRRDTLKQDIHHPLVQGMYAPGSNYKGRAYLIGRNKQQPWVSPPNFRERSCEGIPRSKLPFSEVGKKLETYNDVE